MEGSNFSYRIFDELSYQVRNEESHIIFSQHKWFEAQDSDYIVCLVRGSQPLPV
jgi:ABC-type Na+ transport system ATPase subunit NatA